MNREISASQLEEHFDTPAYFSPEVISLVNDWWDRVTERRQAFMRGEGTSPLGELEELLAPYGITEAAFIGELVVTARFKARENQAENEAG